MKIKEMAEQAHSNALQKGFWTESEVLNKMLGSDKFSADEYMTVERAFQAKKIALIISEAIEALEKVRDGEDESEEMADIVIRVGDYCEGHLVELGKEVEKKMEKNRSRGYRHGREF